MKKSYFVKTSILRDPLAVRCADFNPKGDLYAVGSNSRNVYICQTSSNLSTNGEETNPQDANIVKTFAKHHKGSIYCLSWSPDGRVLATGSNDKTIKLTKLTSDSFIEDHSDEEHQTILNIHEGTVRDCTWISGGQTLVSAGAGDDQVFLINCETGEVSQVKAGHHGHVMCVYSWADSHLFISGGQDGEVMFWDSRVAESVHKVSLDNMIKSEDKCINSACVDPTGRLLVMAGSSGKCSLFDIRGNRELQSLKLHSGEIRCARLCPPATHLMTGNPSIATSFTTFTTFSVGYDGKLILTDLQGDITENRASITVGRHRDKVVNVRWHPEECSLVTCSADKTAACWNITN